MTYKHGKSGKYYIQENTCAVDAKTAGIVLSLRMLWWNCYWNCYV